MSRDTFACEDIFSTEVFSSKNGTINVKMGLRFIRVSFSKRVRGSLKMGTSFLFTSLGVLNALYFPSAKSSAEMLKYRFLFSLIRYEKTPSFYAKLSPSNLVFSYFINGSKRALFCS